MNRTATQEAPRAEDRDVLADILNTLQMKWKWSNMIGFQLYETGEPWNPLTDDGDALRLAVRLNILGLVNERLTRGINIGCSYENTRRAIVDIAAEICKQHPCAKSLDSRKSQQ